MVLNKGPATVIHLSQPIIDGGREVATLHLAGKPGGVALPATPDGEETMIDAAVVEQVIAVRTGLSVSAVRKLASVDLVTVFFTLFWRPQLPSTANKTPGRK